MSAQVFFEGPGARKGLAAALGVADEGFTGLGAHTI